MSHSKYQSSQGNNNNNNSNSNTPPKNPNKNASSSTVKKTKKTQIKPVNEESLELMEHESNWQLMHAAPLTTMTVFEEASPGSFSLSSLYDRIALITKKNPWLTGHLRLMPQGIQLFYTHHFINCFQSITSTTQIYSPSLSYDQIIPLTRPYAVQMGKDCIDTNSPLFLITILQYTSPQSHCKQIILIVSLSPILGDIHTFYQLYSMLDLDNEVITLKTKRHENYITNIQHLIGRKEYNWLHNSWISRNKYLINQLTKERPLQIFTIYFDTENWITRQKEAYQQEKAGGFIAEGSGSHEGEGAGPGSGSGPSPSNGNGNEDRSNRVPSLQLSGGGGTGGGARGAGGTGGGVRDHKISYLSYLSTNDLLTSWFFNLCQCEYGLMSVNFRNRIPRLDERMAGNYSDQIIYRPVDYHLPSLIRLSLGSFRRCGNKNQSTSFKSSSSQSSSLSIFSNKSSSAHTSSLPSTSSYFSFSSKFLSSLPSFWISLQNNSCECHNWCQPYRNICLPGVIQLLHIPLLMDREEMCAAKNSLVIFHPTYGTVGGIIMTHSSEIQEIFNRLMTKYEKNNWRNIDHSSNAHNNNKHKHSNNGGDEENNPDNPHLSEAEKIAPIRNVIFRGRSRHYTPSAPPAAASSSSSSSSTHPPSVHVSPPPPL